MTTAYETRQTAFDEDATLKTHQLVALHEALSARDEAKAEYEARKAEFEALACTLPNGIYRVGPWRVVVDTELKTTIRVTASKK